MVKCLALVFIFIIYVYFNILLKMIFLYGADWSIGAVGYSLIRPLAYSTFIGDSVLMDE